MITGRQVIEALVARGAHVPPQAVVDRYVRSLDRPGIQALVDALRRITNGAEESGEFERLVDTLRGLPLAPAGGQALRVPEPRPGVPSNLGSQPQEGSASVIKLLRSHGTHVYGSGAAVKLELAQLRACESSGEPQYTVQLEGARKQGGTTYDWTRKIAFQLTRRELPVFTAFLLGFAGKSIEFRNHGDDQDKTLALEDQGHKIFLRLSQARHAVIALPIEPEDLYHCGEICMAALQLNRPHGPEARLELLRRVGAMHRARASGSREDAGS